MLKWRDRYSSSYFSKARLQEMYDSERITAYSDAVRNFDLIHNLPPKNADIDKFDFDQKQKFMQLCSKDSFLIPIVYKNKISHFEINKKALKNSIIFCDAKAVYRNQYLRNTYSKQEKATFVIINFALLMLCVLMSESKALLILFKDEFLLDIIATSSYLSLTLVFLAYYFAANFIVFSFDVINDIALGITETHPTLIGSKA